MRAIAGTVRFDGGQVTPQLLSTLEEGLQRRGPDGGSTIVDGPTAMVARTFRTTEECVWEPQPVVTVGGCMLVLDGRLDNRHDLSCTLSENLSKLQFARLQNTSMDSRFTVLWDEHDFSQHNHQPSDSALVAAAFDRWGVSFVKNLIGDFALALWDRRASTLHLARDAFGMRPLYYHWSEKQLIWCSEIEPLVIFLGGRDRLDEEYMAGYIMNIEPWGRSPYSHIASISPGQVVTFTREAMRIGCHWKPRFDQNLRYATDNEYEEDFRLLLTESVACRLRTNRVVMAELSGGLDSSSVVCIANSLVKSRRVPARALRTVSYLFDGSRKSDESSFIQLVEDKVGNQGTHIYDDDILGAIVHRRTGAIPNPMQLFSRTNDQLADLLRASDARVLLTGHAGDHVLMNDPTILPSIVDLICERKPVAAVKLLKEFGQIGPLPYTMLAWKGFIWPFLPLLLKVRYAPGYLRVPDWMNGDLVDRARSRERKVLRSEAKSSARITKQFLYSAIVNAVSQMSRGYYRERACVEMCCPFLHRPLIEFLLAIPSSQLVRPGDRRSLFRRSMKGILPEGIRLRQDKRGPDTGVYEAILRLWPKLNAMFSEAQVYERGYVIRGRFRQELERVRNGMPTNLPLLLRVVSLELWLQTHGRPIRASAGVA